MRHEQLPQILQELRAGLAQHYGARLVRLVLFGSQARGDAVPGSDIDVLVVLRGPVRVGPEIEQTGDVVAAVSLKYDVLVSVIFVSETEYYAGTMPLLWNVNREGVFV